MVATQESPPVDAANPLSPFDRSHQAETYSRQISINRQILTPSDIVVLTDSGYKVLENANGGDGLRSAVEVGVHICAFFL